VNLYDREGEIDPAMLCALLQDNELSAIIADMVMTLGDNGNWERSLHDCLERLEARKKEADYQRLKERALRADLDALAAIQELHRRRAGPPKGAAAT